MTAYLLVTWHEGDFTKWPSDHAWDVTEEGDLVVRQKGTPVAHYARGTWAAIERIDTEK